jgi:hypothetical protein
MSNIYEQKARKYKYKYLKLKQEYIGEGGEINNKLCKSIILTSKFQNLEVKEIYKSSIFRKDWKTYINELHTGKLVWGNPFRFIDNFKIIKQISNYKQYIAKLVYIGKVINKNDLVDGTNKFNKICLESEDYLNDIHIIIRRNVGITFEDFFISNTNITNEVFNVILKSLIDGIKNFIIPLYEKGYVLGSCDKEHLLINNFSNPYPYNKYQVFFDYSLLHPNNDGMYQKTLGKEYTQEKADAFKLLRFENQRDDTLYLDLDPSVGTGIYNTKNSDVYGLCEFIKYLYTKFRPSISISVELKNLSNINNSNNNTIRGFKIILDFLKKEGH